MGELGAYRLCAPRIAMSDNDTISRIPYDARRGGRATLPADMMHASVCSLRH